MSIVEDEICFSGVDVVTQLEDQELDQDSHVQLEQLAVGINASHDECQSALWNAVEAAIQAGRLLRQAKRNVGHGEWRTWVKTNCRCELRQAQRYMYLAEREDEIRENFTDLSKLSINEALRLLRANREDKTARVEVEQPPFDGETLTPEWSAELAHGLPTPEERVRRARQIADGQATAAASDEADEADEPRPSDEMADDAEYDVLDHYRRLVEASELSPQDELIRNAVDEQVEQFAIKLQGSAVSIAKKLAKRLPDTSNPNLLSAVLLARTIKSLDPTQLVVASAE